jgi:uncharacterized membrane protein
MDTARRPDSVTTAASVPSASSSGNGSRLIGVDVARSLALFGMIVAHVGAVPEVIDWGDPTTWLGVVNGRSSVLFAVLAGVSIALVSGRTTPVAGRALGVARVRLAIRAVVLVAVGLLLMALGTPVAVILPTYGLLFLLSLPVLRFRRRWLLVLAAVTVLLSIPVAGVASVLYAGATSYTAQLGLIYPPVTFFGYLLVGLAVGRSDLAARSVQSTLLWLGSAMALLAYSVGQFLAPVDPTAYAYPGVPVTEGATTRTGAVLAAWLSPRDHSASMVDMIGSMGVAIAVIGLCSLLFTGRRGVVSRLVARPFAAVGSMPLTVYSLHLVVLALLLGRPQGLEYGASAVWLFVLGSTVFALLWSGFLGRGPLEAGLAALTRGVGRHPGAPGSPSGPGSPTGPGSPSRP